MPEKLNKLKGNKQKSPSESTLREKNRDKIRALSEKIPKDYLQYEEFKHEIDTFLKKPTINEDFDNAYNNINKLLINTKQHINNIEKLNKLLNQIPSDHIKYSEHSELIEEVKIDATKYETCYDTLESTNEIIKIEKNNLKKIDVLLENIPKEYVQHKQQCEEYVKEVENDASKYNENSRLIQMIIDDIKDVETKQKAESEKVEKKEQQLKKFDKSLKKIPRELSQYDACSKLIESFKNDKDTYNKTNKEITKLKKEINSIEELEKKLKQILLFDHEDHEEYQELFNKVKNNFELYENTKNRFDQILKQQQQEKEKLKEERLEEERLEEKRLEKRKLEKEKLEQERLESIWDKNKIIDWLKSKKIFQIIEEFTMNTIKIGEIETKDWLYDGSSHLIIEKMKKLIKNQKSNYEKIIIGMTMGTKHLEPESIEDTANNLKAIMINVYAVYVYTIKHLDIENKNVDANTKNSEEKKIINKYILDNKEELYKSFELIIPEKEFTKFTAELKSFLEDKMIEDFFEIQEVARQESSSACLATGGDELMDTTRKTPNSQLFGGVAELVGGAQDIVQLQGSGNRNTSLKSKALQRGSYNRMQ